LWCSLVYMMHMFNISTKIAAACTLAALLAGCGSAHSASPPKQPDDGGNFWSTYIKELTSPHPDDACHPQTPADLLAPCDQPGVDIHH